MAAPVISSFTATPASIQPGQPSTLAWVVSGANVLAIAPAPGSVSGSDSVSVYPGLTTTFTLTAAAANANSEQHTIASGSGSDTFTPSPPSSGAWIADGGVTDAAGHALVKVTASPAVGQYSVSTAGVYAFHQGSSALVVTVVYQYTTAAATTTATVTVTVATVAHKLRRAVFGAPAPGQGVLHAAGARFAVVGPVGQDQQAGLLKMALDPRWIGQTLYFKFCSFNRLGSGVQDLASVPAYSYTPLGVAQNQNPNAVNYTNTPAVSLSLTNPTTVHMVQTQVQFPGNTVFYNARDFTIPSLSTTYYVTIQDPGYLGDIGTALTRTAFIESTQAKVGKPGYTYMGSIGPAANATGGSVPVVTPGGMPIAQLFLINGT